MTSPGPSPFPHVRVTGSAFERGRQYGAQARDRIERSIASYQIVFERYAGWDWATVCREAQRYARPIQQYEPKYLQEISGIADGAHLDVADILSLNVRTEIMFAAKAREAAGTPGPAGECSSIAALPAVTDGRRTLIGQNWDWLVSAFETVVVLETEQEDAPSFVTVAEAGMLAKTGLNAAGVGLVTNALVTADDVGEVAVPYHVVLRAVLDADGISDALAAIQRERRASSANFVLAQDDGLAVCVEAMPGDYSRLHVLQPTDGLVVHTNHFLASRFDGKDVGLWLFPDSPFRLQRLTALSSARRPGISADSIMAALTDHVNDPHGICSHPDARLDVVDQAASVASVVMDLTTRVMWLSDGLPCVSGYRALDYSDLLKPGAIRRRSGDCVGTAP